MMQQQSYNKITALLFAIIALLHLWRLMVQLPAQFGDWRIPWWFSLIGLVVAGLLAWAGLRLSKK